MCKSYGKDVRSVDIPKESLWDKIAFGDIEGFKVLGRNREDGSQKGILDNIRIDVGDLAGRPIEIQERPNLSASSVESYFDCPFKFFASRVLRLVDVAMLDIDMDPRSKGLLSHGLLKRLGGVVEDKESITVKEIESMVEDTLKEEEITFFDEDLWETQKERFISIGQTFFKFEKEWKSKFPESKIYSREEPFKVYWNQKLKCLEADPSEESFTLRGRIDRIDKIGENKYVLLDYKSSSNGLRNYGSWIKNGELQLGIYSLVFETKPENKSSEVIGSVYYDIKSFKRETGYLLEDFDGRAFDVGKRRGHKIDSEGLAELRKSILSEVSELVSGIENQRFLPEPNDEKSCNRCQWRSLCRAPHLN